MTDLALLGALVTLALFFILGLVALASLCIEDAGDTFGRRRS